MQFQHLVSAQLGGKKQTSVCLTINQLFLKLCLPLSQLRAHSSGSLSCIFNFCQALKNLVSKLQSDFLSLMLYLKMLTFLGLCFTYQTVSSPISGIENTVILYQKFFQPVFSGSSCRNHFVGRPASPEFGHFDPSFSQ